MTGPQMRPSPKLAGAQSTPSTHPMARAIATMALVGLVTLAGCTAPAEPVTAAPVASAAPSPRLEAEAESALRRMSASMAGATSFAVRMRSQREAYLETGQPVLLSATAAILARRPDRLVAQVGSDVGNFDLWFDGAEATLLNPDANLYGVTAVRGDILAAADWLRDRMGLAMPIRPLLAADPYAAMLAAGPSSGRRMGASLIGTTPVEHFAFRNASFDWEIWLESGARALPRRVSIVERTAQGPARTTLEFESWSLNPAIRPQALRFVAPRGAVRATLVPLPDAEAMAAPR